MFRLAVLALMALTATAFPEEMDPTSMQLRELLKDATLIEGRGLANNQDQNQLQGLSSLSLKYTGCANVYSMGDGQNGGGNKNNGGNVRNNAVVTFELREGCSGTLIGKYATGMTAFTDSYTESTMTEQQWRCETYFEEACYGCQNDGSNYCYSNCISGKTDSSGFDLSVCSQFIKNGNGNGNGNGNAADFEIQRYLECGKLQNNNGNNNNNNNGNYNYNNNAYAAYPAWDGKYRVGPYCAKDGYSIMLGVFYDEFCSVAAPATTYSDMYYGATLPYSTKSIIPKSTCISCVDAQKQYENNQKNGNNYNYNNNNNNNNNQNWYNMEPSEFCMTSYQTSAKCEQASSTYFYYGATSTGCDFINNYISTLTSASHFNLSDPRKTPAAVLAIIFATTTTLFGVYAYFLYRKIKKGRPATGLASQGDMA